jgi:sterol desaturase/sphingolipid hydroxylase (fatty acid hydroxylase superfamily)
VIAGSFFLIFYVWKKNKIKFKKIQLNFPKLSDYQREITYSLITTGIFACYALLVFHPDLLRPYTNIYDDVSLYGTGYFVISIVLILFVHDTYFYWIHRAMHSRLGMKYVHLIHHKSINPSPWAAFSFHPIEALLEASIILIIVFLFPVHKYAVISFMLIMTMYNVYGHLGWELFPRNFHRTSIGKWINTSVNHNLHHKKFDGNYGLYFLIWDRLMGTIRSDYDETFDEVTNRSSEVNA